MATRDPLSAKVGIKLRRQAAVARSVGIVCLQTKAKKIRFFLVPEATQQF
jgi:hypothetical protein